MFGSSSVQCDSFFIQVNFSSAIWDISWGRISVGSVQVIGFVPNMSGLLNHNLSQRVEVPCSIVFPATETFLFSTER